MSVEILDETFPRPNKSRQTPNTDFAISAPSPGQVSSVRRMFLFCFARAKEFEPSRRAENSVPAVLRRPLFRLAAGRTRTGCGAIKLNASD